MTIEKNADVLNLTERAQEPAEDQSRPVAAAPVGVRIDRTSAVFGALVAYVVLDLVSNLAAFLLV